jgi:hypothetical protein
MGLDFLTLVRATERGRTAPNNQNDPELRLWEAGVSHRHENLAKSLQRLHSIDVEIGLAWITIEFRSSIAPIDI